MTETETRTADPATDEFVVVQDHLDVVQRDGHGELTTVLTFPSYKMSSSQDPDHVDQMRQSVLDALNDRPQPGGLIRHQVRVLREPLYRHLVVPGTEGLEVLGTVVASNHEAASGLVRDAMETRAVDLADRINAALFPGLTSADLHRDQVRVPLDEV